MSIKDQIRAEMERRKIVYRSSDNLQDAIRYDEITELIDFLDTLPEQPVSEGLEEEISSYWNRVTGFQPKFAVLELTKEELAKVACHFAEWGAEHLKK